MSDTNLPEKPESWLGSARGGWLGSRRGCCGHLQFVPVHNVGPTRVVLFEVEKGADYADHGIAEWRGWPTTRVSIFAISKQSYEPAGGNGTPCDEERRSLEQNLVKAGASS